MKINVIGLIVTALCGFCHAPRHAYEMLLEHTEISCDGLCPEAQERLLMAAAPEPPDVIGVKYAWNEQRHKYVKWREFGACTSCGALTWRFGNESCEHECKACQRALVDSINAECVATANPPLSKEEVKDLLKGRARQGEPPAPYFPLRFSDYEVPNTRMFEGLPGPRYGKTRPRILFGQAVLPARCEPKMKRTRDAADEATEE